MSRPTTRRERLIWFNRRMAKRKKRKARAEICVDHYNGGLHGLRRCSPWVVRYGVAQPLCNVTLHQLHHGPMVPPIPPFITWHVFPAARRVPPIVVLTIGFVGDPRLTGNHFHRALVGYHHRRCQWMSRKLNRVRGGTGRSRAIAYAVRYFHSEGGWPIWDPLHRLPIV